MIHYFRPQKLKVAKGRVLEMQTMLLCCKTESNERTEPNPWPATPTEMCTDNALAIAVSSFKLVATFSVDSNSQILDHLFLKLSPLSAAS